VLGVEFDAFRQRFDDRILACKMDVVLGHFWVSNAILVDFCSEVRSREQFSRELDGTEGSFSMKAKIKIIRF
tara:strand:+ start:549 stop:764 length:216 start_codon:yes stop_codon:yes gene_type:complete